ncbi:hypothetical protein BN59_01748 [Legionella massiliensis]|uniref:Uncharacterized protein n=1 Tax=Legionella massiliensis TaxID=1034943 RepID=A0A078KSR9_9GAMM|nr:hypothetical protein [Legionella massiliensis]CDZ77465.1 hypothetical protein BN59_01748 [Legionella massiliensis]CEE13203.1 hypothetical protein BN1094_01748 [Legionella massiliensis]
MKIKEILYPKQNGLTGKTKPSAIVVSSPYDDEGGAVKYESALRVVEDRGFTVLSKPGKPVKFSFDGFDSELKPVTGKTTGLTVYLESHGAPGWLFGARRTAKSEMDNTFAFVEYIRELEQKTGLKVNSIILNSCYSANEYYNQSTQEYFISPARVLSYLLPDCDIVGFVGKNATASVNAYAQVTDRKKGITYKPTAFSLEEASVRFSNGSIAEGGRKEIYCDHAYTPPFISKACSIATDSEEYYKPTFGKEIVESLRARSQYVEESYGDRQIRKIQAYLQEQAELALVQAEEVDVSLVGEEESIAQSSSLEVSVEAQQVAGFFASSGNKENIKSPVDDSVQQLGKSQAL